MGGEETVVIKEALFFLKPFISHVGRPAQWGPLLFGRPEGDFEQKKFFFRTRSGVVTTSRTESDALCPPCVCCIPGPC